MSGVDQTDAATPPSTAPPTSDGVLGQQPAFVAPRTYLGQTKQIAPPKVLSGADKEQMEGLVRTSLVRSAFDIDT